MSERRRAVFLLYDALLVGAGLLMLPWLLWRAARSREFRRTLPARLGRLPALPARERRILLHGVSVGEVKALRPLAELLARSHPEHDLVLSASTPTGLATARRLFPDRTVVAFPLDLPGATRRFLDCVRPSCVVLAELEIWPNFLRRCARRGIPVAIVNGRITERSMSGYRRVQKWLPQFDRIALYAVQSRRYAERFAALDVPPERVVVTGNLKFDNLPEPAGGAPAGPWSAWLDGRPLAVLASTHAPEERDLVAAWARRAAARDAVLAVVPRHPGRSAPLLGALRRAAGETRPCLRSRVAEDAPLPPGAILLMDSFGELEGAYAAARAAFVGGSLALHGGQNVLEPAAAGVPVVVGPHTENFADEVALLREACALRVAGDAEEVIESLMEWLGDAESAARVGGAGAHALASRRGAAQSTLQALQEADLL